MTTLPLVIALALLAPLHPDSLSSSQVTIRGAQVELAVRCQIMSLLEVIAGLDADGDDEVSPAEVEASRQAILDYVSEHYLLTVGSDRDLTGGTRLRPEPVAVRHRSVSQAIEDGLGFRKGSVDIELAFTADAPIRDLLVECTLFFDTSPDHIDLATVAWDDGPIQSFGLEARQYRVRIDPEGRGAFGAFVRLGWRHILGGWDHLAFVLALVLASRRLRSLLGVVTAFTLAHSLTLVLAALDVIDVSRYAQLVEAGIALSIAYVALDNLLHPHLARSRWIEAGAFGLLHGLGFAGFLKQSLVQETSRSLALFGFNVGVELGQVAVVLVCVAALALLRRWRRPEADPFLAPASVRRVGSAAIALAGLWWFVLRV